MLTITLSGPQGCGKTVVARVIRSVLEQPWLFSLPANLRYEVIEQQTGTVQEEAFEAIRGERRYQDQRWNGQTTSTGGIHSVTEFLVFIRSYLNEAMEHVSRNAEPDASDHALGIVRKIGGLAVACMEQNGVVKR
jgi:hypothetical protein